MNILMYSDVFGGPTTTFIANDLKSILQTHEVKYLCTSIANIHSSFKDVVAVDYKVNPVKRKIRWILEKNGWYLEFFNKAFSEKVNRVISSFRPDIIQCNFGYEALRLTDNLDRAHGDIPLVINFLGYDASFHLSRNSYVRKLRALSEKKNIYATCNTFFLKHNLEEKKIFFRENKVIHTGVDLDFFDRKGDYSSAENEYVFLQIATLAERKGQEVTLKAFKKLLESHRGEKRLKLILAGGKENKYGDWIRSLPSKLGISESVKFLDWITPDKARALMLRVNCFVHHSRTVNARTEGIPTAVSEAMAMELPVISTWHAGIPELVEDGVNGFLVNENDTDGYCKRMFDILTWKYLPINREKVKTGFNIIKRAEEFENLYKDILSGKQ